MVTVKNDAHRKHTAAKNHGVLFVENRVVKADFRSNREALFEEEVDIIFSHPFTFGDFVMFRICGGPKNLKSQSYLHSNQSLMPCKEKSWGAQ